MAWFMAGAIAIGPSKAKVMVVSKSSPLPLASLDIVSAVQGAINSASAHLANSIWPIAASAFISNKSDEIGLAESACKVKGVTNSCEDLVITTLTSAFNFFRDLTISADL